MRSLEKIRSVLARTGKSRTALYEDIRAGRFPAPVKIGARAIAFDSEAVDRWIEAQLRAAQQGVRP